VAPPLPHPRAGELTAVATLGGLRHEVGSVDLVVRDLDEAEACPECGSLTVERCCLVQWRQFRPIPGNPTGKAADPVTGFVCRACALARSGEFTPHERSRTMRTVLIHLNVEAPDDDPRTAEEISAAVMGAVEVGSDDDSVSGLVIEAVLTEEV
jgi:hypothetical protein